MKKKLLTTISLFFISTISFADTLKSVNQLELKAALNNNAISTIWLTMLDDSLMGNGLTLDFHQDGKVHGKFATKPDNEPQENDGTWVVKNDGELCFTWNSWNKAKQSCVYVYDLKSHYLFARADGTYETLAAKPTPAVKTK